MVLFGLFGSSSPLPNDGTPTRLPDYFPVQPKGCEKVSEKLFACVTDTATAKARDLEKAGFHKSYYDTGGQDDHDADDDTGSPSSDAGSRMSTGGEASASVVVVVSEPNSATAATTTTTAAAAEQGDDGVLPRRGENPLDMCRKDIEQYMICCNRELKKKQNWILTEPYRVQEEYRYEGASSSPSK